MINPCKVMKLSQKVHLK